MSGFVFLAFGGCFGEEQDVLCAGGYGRFETKFATGVSVMVGAPKSGGFANRSCGAALAWERRDLPVVAEASQVDIDVLGADLGLGTPVVAFQIKKAAADSDMTYEIYSLNKPPKLLRTIEGGDFFRAVDTDFNGRIEIWTGDVRAVSGFEGLVPGELEFAPTVVLRFEHNRILDVSAEFQSYFDKQITKVRAELSGQELSDFRASDGKLADSLTLAPIRLLRITKIKVLEIVWSYLYSGREPEAWRALADMWPAADFERIRSAILDARAHGIRSQIDGVAPQGSRLPSKQHVYVFDAIKDPAVDEVGHSPFAESRPQPFLLRRPPPVGAQGPPTPSQQMVELVIDAAGKVWSAEVVGPPDKELIDATRVWKFIPAFTGGHAVASRLRMSVSPNQ